MLNIQWVYRIRYPIWDMPNLFMISLSTKAFHRISMTLWSPEIYLTTQSLRMSFIVLFISIAYYPRRRDLNITKSEFVQKYTTSCINIAFSRTKASNVFSAGQHQPEQNGDFMIFLFYTKNFWRSVIHPRFYHFHRLFVLALQPLIWDTSSKGSGLKKRTR